MGSDGFRWFHVLSVTGLVGMVTRSAWQGYKPQIVAAPRDLSQILSSYNFGVINL